MRKRILLIAVMFLAISSLAVYAQAESQQNGEPLTTTSAGQQGSDSQKCVDVTRKVGLVVDRYNQSQEKYINAFESIFQNVEKLALKFKADGYDTGTLEADLAKFNNMIQTTSRYYNEFANGLENSKKGVCGNSEINATQEFTKAREQLSLCKKEMVALKEFAQETLKKDLMDLKAQVTE